MIFGSTYIQTNESLTLKSVLDQLFAFYKEIIDSKQIS